MDGLQKVTNFLVPATGSTNAFMIYETFSATARYVNFNNVELDGLPFRPSGVLIDNTQGAAALEVLINEISFRISCPAGQTLQMPYPAPLNHTANITGSGLGTVLFVDYPVVPFSSSSGGGSSGGLTDAELRASPVPISGPLTNTELRASPLDVRPSVTRKWRFYETTSGTSVKVGLQTIADTDYVGIDPANNRMLLCDVRLTVNSMGSNFTGDITMNYELSDPTGVSLIISKGDIFIPATAATYVEPKPEILICDLKDLNYLVRSANQSAETGYPTLTLSASPSDAVFTVEASYIVVPN